MHDTTSAIHGRSMAARRPRHTLTRLAVAAAFALGLVLIIQFAGAVPASAYPPDPSSPETAAARLAGLDESAESGEDSYDRDKFPHWSTVDGACNTREIVLQRDGTDVVVDPDTCGATSGSWYSTYDATWVTDSSSIDIDHIVPLAEAWRSGADSWTTSRRESFANDLAQPQLIAVSASSNRSKGDRDPAEWQPTNGNVHCVYSRQWIDVKHTYGLSVDGAEKNALEAMLATC